MANDRDYENRDPDTVMLFDELFYNGLRDPKGLPLGNVEMHYRKRLTKSYTVLCLVKACADLDYMTPHVEVTDAPAEPQDRKGYTPAGAEAREYNMAHAVPCYPDFEANNEVRKIDHCFRRPNIRNMVRFDVLGATTQVHRLVNQIADVRCEKSGMKTALIDACGAVVNDGIAPMDAYQRILLPGYRNATQQAFSAFEQITREDSRWYAESRHLVTPAGRPLTPRPADVRIHSPNPAAQIANRGAVLTIFREYLRIVDVDADQLRAETDKVRFWMDAEKHA